MAPVIPVFDVHDPLDTKILALREAGAIRIRGVTTVAVREAVTSELTPFLLAAPVQTNVAEADFYPGHTRRITALVRKSPAVHELMLHPDLLGACDAVLLPNCERYQLHVGSALVVGPGARVQVLHREDDTYPFFEVPRPNLIVASMWAITDFTAANGATNIVPGSHLWPAGRQAEPHETVPAEMAAGDVLIWLGGTLHGAGANVSGEWRHGVFLSFSLGWLRQEENQYLDVPPAEARALPKEIRDLLGYPMHGGLGFHERDSSDQN